MADRVLVMHEGRLTAELSRAEADEESVIRAATGQLRGGGRMSVDAAAAAESAAGAPAHRVGLPRPRARHRRRARAADRRHRDPRAALHRDRLAAQPRAQRLDLRDPRRRADARARHPQRRPLGRLRARLSAYFAGDLLSNHPGMALPLVFVLGIALGAACGLLNGILVTWGQVPALVVTLGTLYMFRGLAFVWTNGQQINAETLPDSFLNLGTDSILGHPDPRDHRAGRDRGRRASGCATSAPAASSTRSARTPRARGWPASARSAAC